jgi:hypothetical protein
MYGFLEKRTLQLLSAKKLSGKSYLWWSTGARKVMSTT